MTNEELEQLARLVAARILPSAELLTEVGNETKAAAKQLRNERAAMPEVTGLAERIAALEETIETRLPRQPRPPRPWNLKWWLKAPPPKWWPWTPGWWPVSRTMTGAAIALVLASTTWWWTTPLVTLNADYQYWMGIRLTWWL